MKKIKLSIGILAGGKSTRMGENKAFLTINNKRFIDKISEELSGFSQIIISAAQKGIYEDTGFKTVYDRHENIGPIEGISRIIDSSEEEYVFICAADMPFITKELVMYMTEFISSDYDCYVMEDDEHIHPLCAIYSKKTLDAVNECIEKGQYRLRKVLDSVRTKYIKLEYTCFDKKTVRNINTRAEYEECIKPVVFCVSGIKNSGKTGIIVKLINEFINEGYTVGTIKHDGHDYVMDYEGTDSFRFTQAGAVNSAVFSKNQYSLNHKGETSIADMVNLCKGVDIIIIEGMKDSAYPKIEVLRNEVSSSLCSRRDTLICVAADIELAENITCPVYDINDIESIFACVKKYFGIQHN